MEDELVTAIGEFSLHVAAKMMGKTVVSDHRALPAPSIEVNRTVLANAVLDSCVEQASQIVMRLNLIDQLNDQRGDFGLIVGIIAREQLSVIEYLTGTQLSLPRDCSRNVGETCMRAVAALRE